MAESVLILGESGTGKSRSLKHLDPSKTFLVNCYGKPLPFKGWKNMYKPVTKGDSGGNSVNTDTVDGVVRSLSYAESSGFETVVVDDYQFVACMKTIRDANIKGFDKFTEIAQGFIQISDKVKSMSPSMTVVFLSHTETDNHGKTKAKTAGKMVDNVIGFESLFTVVLQTFVEDGSFGFLTQNNGSNTVKSPEDMFSSGKIPNDLRYVLKCIECYNNGEDIPQIQQ